MNLSFLVVKASDNSRNLSFKCFVLKIKNYTWSLPNPTITLHMVYLLTKINKMIHLTQSELRTQKLITLNIRRLQRITRTRWTSKDLIFLKSFCTPTRLQMDQLLEGKAIGLLGKIFQLNLSLKISINLEKF